MSDSCDKEKLYHEFRTIIGSIVTLAEPLSVTSLGALLCMPTTTIARRVHSLHSVLQVPADAETPIRTLHLSFREFLLSDKLQQESLGVDGPATHRMLSTRCLQLLSAENGLHENMCNLRYPGQLRKQISPAIHWWRDAQWIIGLVQLSSDQKGIIHLRSVWRTAHK
jgi:hypothetical protein